MSYLKLSDGATYSNPSYTIRAFMPNFVNGTVINQDIYYHSPTYMGTYTVGSPTNNISNPVSEGWTGQNLTQTTLSGTSNPAQDPGTVVYPGAFNQITLGGYTQINLETGSYLSTDADGFKNNGLNVAVGTASIITLDSTFSDNLLATPFDGAGTWYLQMPIWGLPASTAHPRLDLANSYIVLSSSGTFAPAQTGSISFSSGSLVNSLSGGGDLLWKVNRDYFNSIGLGSVQRIQFILQGGGTVASTFQFKTGPMKLVKSTYLHNTADVDTKLGQLKQERWPGIGQGTMPILYQDGLIAKNFDYIVRFSSGTAPGTATPNEFNAYTRIKSDRSVYLRTQVQNSVNWSKIIFYETGSIIRTIQGPPLDPGDYYLFVKHKDTEYSATIYSANNFNLSSPIISTSEIVITDTWLRGTSVATAGQGYTGYQLIPQYGDFYIDNIYSQNVVLAQYESKGFKSNLPVVGVNLFTTEQSDSNLFTNVITDFSKVVTTDNLQFGIPETGDLDTDVVVTTDNQIKFSTLSLKVTKNLANAYIASIQHPTTIKANEFNNLIFKCKLRFEESLKDGTFKLVFWDKLRSKILYVVDILGLKANTWNDVSVAITNDNLYNNEFIFEIGHFGSGAGSASYWIEDAILSYESIRWEASNDGGLSYMPFLTATGDIYRSINFPTTDFYQTVLNKSPAIFWDFNRREDYNSSIVQNEYPLGSNNGTLQGAIYWRKTPGTLAAIGGTTYVLPSSSPKEKQNVFYSGACVLLENGGTVSCGTPVGLSGTSLTAETWFYTEYGTVANAHLLIKQGTTATNDWNFKLSGSASLVFTAIGVATVTATIPDFRDKNWHQAAFTYNANSIKIYYDGNPVAFGTATATLSSTKKITVEGPDWTTPGTVNPIFDKTADHRFQDSVILYSTVLDDDSIKSHYNAKIRTFNELKIKASAFTRDAWVSGYEVIPRYAQVGQIAEGTNRFISSFDQFNLTEKTEDYWRFDYSLFDIDRF